jgi:hypothetical protein
MGVVYDRSPERKPELFSDCPSWISNFCLVFLAFCWCRSFTWYVSFSFVIHTHPFALSFVRSFA